MTWNGASTGMIKSPLKIVCDSDPFIHLDELNCLHLLEDFEEILIPDTVHKEIKRYRPLSLSKLNVPFIFPPGNIPDNTRLLTLCRIFSLDAGEIEALALIEKNPQAIFLTDDASARMVAEQMGFRVHGTIGILLRSIRRGQLEPEEVLGILQRVPSKSTLYIKHSLTQRPNDVVTCQSKEPNVLMNITISMIPKVRTRYTSDATSEMNALTLFSLYHLSRYSSTKPTKPTK